MVFSTPCVQKAFGLEANRAQEHSNMTSQALLVISNQIKVLKLLQCKLPNIATCMCKASK